MPRVDEHGKVVRPDHQLTPREEASLRFFDNHPLLFKALLFALLASPGLICCGSIMNQILSQSN